MPEYLAPGVYVEEVSSGSKPIEGVSTSTAGFLGITERGPESPQFISSWLQFQRVYGSYLPDQSYLAYAVQGFFDNGGQRCYVGRIASENAVAAMATIGNLVVSAIGRGAWGNEIEVQIEPATQNSENWVKVTISYQDVLEIYDNVTHESGSNNLVITINNASNLIRAWWSEDGAAKPDAGTTQLADGADSGGIDEDEDGDGNGDGNGNGNGNGNGDGNGNGNGNGNGEEPEAMITVADFQGDTDPIPTGFDGQTPIIPPGEELGRGRGLAALAEIDPISLLVVPDEVRSEYAAITTDVINQCENLKDRFAIVSAPLTTSPETRRQDFDTSYAGYYHPWIRVFDPSINFTRAIPPTGHIAGVYARTDIERGVHKAPANEVVRGATDLQLPVTKALQDMLNPIGVNCSRDFRSDGRGIRVWGARTMSSDPEWKYVNVRRLFLFVEESIDEGTQWVVFEPNHEPTWAAVVRNLTNFLISVWRSGALMGVTQDEAFFVKCDRTTMTQDDIDNGRLICYIGIAPVKPAEFVIFRISQKTIEATG